MPLSRKRIDAGPHTELMSVKATLGTVTFVICATPSRLLVIKIFIEVPSMKRDRRALTKRKTFGLFTPLIDSPHKWYILRNARRRKTPSGRIESILRIRQKAEIHSCTKAAFTYPSSNLIVKSRGLQSLPTVKCASFGQSEIMLQDGKTSASPVSVGGGERAKAVANLCYVSLPCHIYLDRYHWLSYLSWQVPMTLFISPGPPVNERHIVYGATGMRPQPGSRSRTRILMEKRYNPRTFTRHIHYTRSSVLSYSTPERR
jgi:hypothetical protein